MARGKSTYNITAAKRDRRIKAWEAVNAKGRKYIPFIDPRDIKSDGSKGRVPDFENDGQDRRVLSNNERLFAYLLMFDNNILWCKEQYPLLPLERSIEVAKRLGLRHPKYPGTSVHAVMTTDFYCGKIDGAEVVYSIKDDDQMKELTERKLKNLEDKEKIQRAFWKSKGITYHLIYSSQLKQTPFTRNLGKLATNLNIPYELELILKRWLSCFEQALQSIKQGRLSSLLKATSQEVGINYQESVTIFQHCLWHKIITANLNIPLLYEKPISGFNLKVANND
jgi:hypothetical protein